MQRWWFLDNKNKVNVSPTVVPAENVVPEVVEKLREWTFRVFVTQQLSPFEAVAVTGETCALGNWKPKQCVALTKENGGRLLV